MVRNVAAVIIAAVGGARPAIIAAALDKVDLIAAHRPHLHFPEPPARIEGQAEKVAVTQSPDLRGHPAPRGEGIVGRHRAVVVQPHDLAEIAAHILRRIEMLALARADIELAVRPEGDAVREMAAAVHLRLLAPDHLQVAEAGAGFAEIEMCPADDGAARAIVARLDPAQIDQPVLRETGVEDDVTQAALPSIRNLRHAGDVEHSAVGTAELQAAAFLCHQQVAIGQKGHRPRLVELADLLHLEGALRRTGRAAAAGGEQQQQGKQEAGAAHLFSPRPPPPERSPRHPVPSRIQTGMESD